MRPPARAAGPAHHRPGRGSRSWYQRLPASGGRRGHLALAGGPGQSASARFTGPPRPGSPGAGTPGPRRVRRARHGPIGPHPRAPRWQHDGHLLVSRGGGGVRAHARPRHAFCTTQASVEDADAVLDLLGVRRALVYGTSYGTKPALRYGEAQPDRVRTGCCWTPSSPRGPVALRAGDIGALTRCPRRPVPRALDHVTPDLDREERASCVTSSAAARTSPVWRMTRLGVRIAS